VLQRLSSLVQPALPATTTFSPPVATLAADGAAAANPAAAHVHGLNSHVYFVSAISRIDHQLIRLATHIGMQATSHRVAKVSFVLVIMGDPTASGPGGKDKEESDLEDGLRAALGGTVALHIVRTRPPFGRAIGLRMGFDHVAAVSKAAGESPSSVLVHSFDSRLTMKPDFAERFARMTACGLSAYAPVCVTFVHAFLGDS
jgi:hypothetical protein